MRQLPHPDCASRQVTAARSPARAGPASGYCCLAFRVCDVGMVALPGSWLPVRGWRASVGGGTLRAVRAGGRGRLAAGRCASGCLRRGRVLGAGVLRLWGCWPCRPSFATGRVKRRTRRCVLPRWAVWPSCGALLTVPAPLGGTRCTSPVGTRTLPPFWADEPTHSKCIPRAC